MLEALSTFLTLRWRPLPPRYSPLPPHIQRVPVPTLDGNLELLICEPKPANVSKETASKESSPPIFFLHGGYGSAGVWLDWMTHLHNAGYQGPLYACSLRNHGGSYIVPYWRMVFCTSLDAVASDALACIDFAKLHFSNSNGLTPILVGHSSGGGLAQYVLANNRTRVQALCLVDSVPHFSNLDVYWNWLKHDPWFPIRSMLHLQHPSSPLSTTKLIHGAFFGHLYPFSRVQDFMRSMPAYESMGWPLGMMGNFSAWWRGKSSWLDAKRVLQGIDLDDVKNPVQDKVCVLVGSEDMMIDEQIYMRQTRELREATRALLLSDRVCEDVEKKPTNSSSGIDDVFVESHVSVRLIVVKAAGHHVQNDVPREKAAEALLQFARQVL